MYEDWIDAATYEDLLRKWRFAKVDDPIFVGKEGKKFRDKLNAKREELTQQEIEEISKRVGWEQPTNIDIYRPDILDETVYISVTRREVNKFKHLLNIIGPRGSTVSDPVISKIMTVDRDTMDRIENKRPAITKPQVY